MARTIIRDHKTKNPAGEGGVRVASQAMCNRAGFTRLTGY